MTEEKSKINSSAPPQARSLRPRKRKSPSDDVQAPHQQDAEKDNTAVVSTPLQCPQSPVQQCAEITDQQDQGSEQSCATKREKDAGHFTNVELTEQDVTNLPNNSKLEGFQVLTESGTNKSGMNEEEIGSDEFQRSLHQICAAQAVVFSPITKESDQSCATALNAKNTDVERNQQTGPKEPINVCMDYIKDLIKESTAGLPAKKKRRMGMCGLTEKERSHFLLTQKHENGQNREDKVEKPICDNSAEPLDLGKNTSSSSLPSSPPSILAEGQNVELGEEALKHQSSHCEADEKAESETHGAVSPSDGTTIWDSGCTEGKGCECEDGFVTDSEQAANSDQLAENEAGGNLDSQTLQELKAYTNEVTAEIPEKPEEDGSADGNRSSAVSICTSQDEKSDNWNAVEAPLLQVKSVTGTRAEKKEEMSNDVVGGDGADEGASCSHTQLGGLKCEAAATPSVSETKDSCDSDEPAAGSSTARAEHAHTLDTADSFGCGCLDYVSDSQLNTIVLLEDEIMQKDEGPDSSDCHEDATELICGLIRELASLNWKVMATHRELESLRRSSKTSRSSTR